MFACQMMQLTANAGSNTIFKCEFKSSYHFHTLTKALTKGTWPIGQSTNLKDEKGHGYMKIESLHLNK